MPSKSAANGEGDAPRRELRRALEGAGLWDEFRRLEPDEQRTYESWVARASMAEHRGQRIQVLLDALRADVQRRADP